jgi:hypothetical protein
MFFKKWKRAYPKECQESINSITNDLAHRIEAMWKTTTESYQRTTARIEAWEEIVKSTIEAIAAAMYERGRDDERQSHPKSLFSEMSPWTTYERTIIVPKEKEEPKDSPKRESSKKESTK